MAMEQTRLQERLTGKNTELAEPIVAYTFGNKVRTANLWFAGRSLMADRSCQMTALSPHRPLVVHRDFARAASREP